MQFDKNLMTHKLQRWGEYICSYQLPDWDSIPDLGLYMDQVVTLLEDYLNFIPRSNVDKDGSFVTPATINNYVRLKVMPAPIKRKYYRIHIAYLIIILTIKQGLSISDIQTIIPPDLSEEQVEKTYEDYSEKFKHLALFFISQVQTAAEEMDDPQKDSTSTVGPLVIESALISGFAKILAEKLLRLSDADPEEVLATEIQR